jgi:hypothetical protein
MRAVPMESGLISPKQGTMAKDIQLGEERIKSQVLQANLFLKFMDSMNCDRGQP